MKIHKLKIWPKFFAPLFASKKCFEIRKNDRSFKPGDAAQLREWCPKKKRYTGRFVEVIITRVWRQLPGIEKGYVVLSFYLTARVS